MDGAYDVAISADGRNVYVAARVSSAVATFARDPATGALAQLGGENGCIAQGGVDGCRPSTSPSLRGARGVAVSPDGRNVYAGAFSASALSIFRRKPGTGALRRLRAPGAASPTASRDARPAAPSGAACTTCGASRSRATAAGCTPAPAATATAAWRSSDARRPPRRGS